MLRDKEVMATIAVKDMNVAKESANLRSRTPDATHHQSP
jgi:hypothetical protein